MGLPRYIVNNEEFVDSFHKVILKGYEKGEVYKGVQRSKGLRIKFEQNEDFIQKKIPYIGGFTLSGLMVERQFHENNRPDEHWSLKLDDILLYDSIYMKNENIWKGLKMFHDIPENSELIFEYYNTSKNEKSVWLDLDFLTEVELVGGEPE